VLIVEYDSRTALIVVDVQHDFADPGGSLYVSRAEEVIPFINEQVDQAAAAGATVIYSQDWHPATTPHFQKNGGIWPVHCVGGSTGAEFHPDLQVIEGAIITHKGVGGEDGYSVFNVRDPESGAVTPTGLADRLADAVDTVVIVGLALDYCVKESALDAADWFETVVLADGTRAVDLSPGDGARAVAALVDAGVTIA
jgi:nicotinamidase/pyrazinamidase